MSKISYIAIINSFYTLIQMISYAKGYSLFKITTPFFVNLPLRKVDLSFILW